MPAVIRSSPGQKFMTIGHDRIVKRQDVEHKTQECGERVADGENSDVLEARQAGEQPMQRIEGGDIGDAVDLLGAEVTLEGFDHALRLVAELAGYGNAITIQSQARV